MKKKITLVLLIVLLMFTITGCEKKATSKIPIDNDYTVRLGDVFFVFDQDLEFHNFKYKGVKYLNLEEKEQSAYFGYTNEDIYKGKFVFRVNLSFSNEKSVNDYLEGHESSKENINGISWDKATINSKIDDKDTTVTVYATQKNSTVYAVYITKFSDAEVDLSELTKVFMNGVTIK